MYVEYRISNPYKIEKLVTRATFGYVFKSPLRVSYSESSKNVYVLASDPQNNNQLVMLGFNSEEPDVDGLDSVVSYNDEADDLMFSVAGRHDNDFVMAYD
jgi:hypothetical protein